MRTIALLGLATSCAGTTGTAVRPDFPPPRGGVFQSPVPVVKSTDDDLLPSIVPGNSSVVYAAKVEGNLDIYTRPIAGGAPVRLTTHSADDTDPAFSLDGERVAWTSQADDVKGDIWVMDADGDSKRRLTGRDTSDRGPTWSPDGRIIYFTSRARGTAAQRVDAYDLDLEQRTTVVEGAWDPSISSDGRYMFYVALDDRPQPRIYARRMSDGQVAALTDGAYIEGIPRVARGVATTRVLFTRWVDDQTGDGVIDVDDAPSLWAIDFDDTLFTDGGPPPARPLTAGEGGEIFASVASDWLVYTTTGFGDLEIYALPADGVINAGAGPEAILEAARAEDNPAIRRLALRYLVATTPSLAASARYELARELAERGRLTDAIDELSRVIEVAAGEELEGVARIEVERLRMLDALRGTLVVREEAERRFTQERTREVKTIAEGFPRSASVRARGDNTLAEADYALGRRDQAIAAFDDVAHRDGVPDEDGARALDRLGEIFADVGSLDAVARISEVTLRRFPNERYYARRAADRWVTTARASVGAPAPAALENIVRGHEDLPTVAARAAVALAREQEAAGHEDVAIEQWKRIATEYTGERAIQADALITLGETAERQGQRNEAIEAYERLIAEFAGQAELRARALQGLTRIALAKARAEERQGQEERARQSYRRLLRNNREISHAHRRYIALSAELGHLETVLSEYEAAAEANPRDKYARYGYGYALAFESPPDLGDIEHEVEAALGLDPRLAAAHVTLGWVRELRDERDPRGGWLEKAVSSYETAWSLVDPKNEPELWAAAKLNHGNALMKLGKTDFALQAYLDRELSQVPFDNPVTELLFRQRFAQTALREGALDVALDMARLGFAKARSMPGRPRLGSMAALNAAVALNTGSYADAAVWFDKARAIYEKKEDWQRVIPMLRGQALSLEMLGRPGEALETWNQILGHLEAGRGPEDMDYCWSKPALRLFGIWIPMRVGLLEQEIAANSQSVTGAICGFSAEQEEEIARHAAARLASAHGDLARARELDTVRIELAEAAAADSRRGLRVRRELVYALNTSALLAVRAGDWLTASERWLAALPIARSLGGCDDLTVDPRAKGPVCTAVGLQVDAWADTATMLGSIARAWIEQPSLRTDPLLSEAERTASVGIEATATAGPEVSRRLARWLALDRLSEALTPFAPPPEKVLTEPGQRVATLLSHLDTAAQRVEEGLDHARVAGDPELIGHLERIGSPGTDEPEARAERIAASPLSWRARFDRSLWDRAPDVRGPDPGWLRAAVEAFEGEPVPEGSPARGAFLAAAVQVLVGDGEIERAWRLLERNRLLRWQPAERRAGGELGREWQRVRALRDVPEKYGPALAAAPPLVRALEGHPATVEEVQKSLEGRGLLLQVFAPLPDEIHFFAVDAFGVSHVPGTSVRTIPEALLAHIAEPGADEAPRFYIDAGELLTSPLTELTLRGEPLRGYATGEILSATYLVAAWSLRNLARDGVLAIDSPAAIEESVLPGRANVRLALPARYQSARFERPGLGQLQLGNSATSAGIDLDRIAALDLRANLAVASGIPSGAEPARALFQSLLLAGVPSLLVAPMPADRLAHVTEEATRQRVVDLVSEGERLFGFHGLTFDERIEFALSNYSHRETAGKKALISAKKGDAIEDWSAARREYGAALDALAFLTEPEASAALAEKGDASIKKLLNPMTVAGKQALLAEILTRLEEHDEAAALQLRVADTFAEAGVAKAAVTMLDRAGQNLAKSDRHEDAIARFQRCVELSRDAKNLGSFEAECLSRLGSEKRALLDYPAAVELYQQAIAAYEKLGSAKQITTRRFLGILYESSLNDYARALEQYQKALAVADKLGAADWKPTLMLDIVRIFRSQGDYEEALTRALEAQKQLPAVPTEEQAASMKRSDVDRIHSRHADVSLEIAKIYWYRGNYRRAVEYQTRGLEHARSGRDSFREIQAVSLAGLIALNQGELERAERSSRAALQMARAADRDDEVAKQLNNLGTVLREAGRVPEAIERFREALAIDERLGSVEGRAYDLRNLAVALYDEGQLEEALERVTQALELSRSIGEQYNQLRALFAAGEILEALGDPTSQERYQAATELARKTSVPEVEWRSLYALGRRAREQGDVELARQLVDEALEVAERLGRGQSGASTEHNRDDLYADAIELAVAAGDTARAFGYTERARARDLLDVLASRTVELPSPDAKKAMARELRAREAVMAARRGVRLGEEGAAQRLSEAETKHQSALDSLRAAFPRLARTFTIDPIEPQRLQETLPADAVVVSFFVGRKHTTAITLSRDQMNVFALEIPAADLNARVGRLRESMRAFGEVEDAIAELGSGLIAPLGVALAEAKVVVVLPHGPLHYVPFAALSLGGEALLDRMVVATAPSGSALYDQLRQPARPRPKRIAVMAPAVDLPFARLEALAIAGDRAVLGAAATESTVRGLSADALDLAAHGRLNTRDPLASAIELAPGDGEDGRLEMHEIFALRGLPPLVTLSACDSASPEVRGSEWLSLGGAFLTAGSRTVIASQNRVSDLAAAVMMKRFYRIVRNESAGEALRQAALAVREYFAHPAHWSSFVLMGDFR